MKVDKCQVKILSVLIAIIFSSNSFASDNRINTVGRTGCVFKNNDVERTGTPNSSSFNIDYLRITFYGTVSSSEKYKLAIDLLGGTAANDSVDGSSPLVNQAYVVKTFASGTSALIGKQFVVVGGREYDYFKTERYTSSSFYSATPINQVGLILTQEIAGQIISAE